METPREIFRKIMHYERPERMFNWNWTFGLFGGKDKRGPQFWQQTIDRWHNEGLPPEVNNQKRVNSFFKVDRPLHLRLRIGIWPPFEETVLEETDGFQISIDEHSALVKQFKGASLESSMPEYLRHPVTSCEEWKCFARERLDPDAPGREGFDIIKDGQTLLETAPGASNFSEARTMLINSELPVELGVGSLYGWPRNWMGLTGLSYALYDDEALVAEIVTHLADLALSVFSQVLDPLGVPIDFAAWWEDMACKHGPLISPVLKSEKEGAIFTHSYPWETESLCLRQPWNMESIDEGR